jgi:Sulfotransferase family
MGETVTDARSTAPVFVLGCPRSGTTLLYHMLLSAGGFAVYRAETHVFDVLARRFGELASLSDRKRLMEVWLQTENFRRSGLTAVEFKTRVLGECRSGGDFLRLLMESIARQQGVPRWAECTPEHLLYQREIRESIPDALIIHVIRDGRDVAMSLAKQGWIRPFPWDADAGLMASGMYWSWIVHRGRQLGRTVGPGYAEVRFEDLTLQPRETLAGIGTFIGQELDYDKILKVGIGSVSEPNTSFGDRNEGFSPVGRWQTLAPDHLGVLQSVLGDRLGELGYAVTATRSASVNLRARSALYPAYFTAKQWLKSHTVLSRIVDTGLLR